jgi:hypothetical protein
MASRPAQGNNNPKAKPAPRLDNSQRKVTVRPQPGNVNPKITRGSMAGARKPPSTAHVVQS